MAKWGKRRTRTSPPAAALPSTTTVSANPASSSPYFLPDLIPLVASRLTTLEDFFALRAACRAYRARLPLSSSNLASQGPLLLVRHKASASEALFHVPRRRILRFRLPCARRRGPIPTCLRCLFPARVALADPSPTSFHSFGCRVAIQDAGRPELRIRHLLTGKRAGARLPGPPEECDAVIFSGDLVIAFTQWRPDLYYCRTGDAHWRTAWCDVGYQLYNLMSVEGTLYALTYPNYGLATVELDNNSVVLSFLEDKLSAETVLNCSTLWLAECHGELLLIVRTSTYHVFRWESGERKWARTESLGGCSLFFNIHEFAGSLGPDHPAVRRDCLYFTGWSGNWSEYSLVDGSLHENVVDYPGQAARKDYVPLAWVLPSIC